MTRNYGIDLSGRKLLIRPLRKNEIGEWLSNRITSQNTPMKTDHEIQNDVRTELMHDPYIHASQIGVEASNGVVTLSGHTESHHEKRKADIETNPRLSIPLIKKGITESFRRRAIDEANNLDIVIDHNIVTLSGKVHSWFERNSAISAVWAIPSVKNVIDKIQIVN